MQHGTHHIAFSFEPPTGIRHIQITHMDADERRDSTQRRFEIRTHLIASLSR